MRPVPLGTLPWYPPLRQTPSALAALPLCLAPRSAPNPPLALPDEIAVPHPSPTPSAPYQAAFLPTTVPCSQASYFLRLGPQNPGNHLRHAVPVLRLALQPFSSCCRQPVIFRLPLILRFAPLARNP